MEALVEVERVAKSYRLGRVSVVALRAIDLEIFPGEFAVLAGPSGSGKTTLLNILGCIDKPTSGHVAVGGKDVTKTPLHALSVLRRNQIGYIFQTFNLIPVLTAFENVEYPLLLSRVDKKERQSRVANWLRHVGLEQQAKQRPDQLSGGQRQRVAIARAMVMEPRLVLADEPTANLDSETAGSILDLLVRINEQTGATFLFSTHDPQVIGRARRRIQLHDGQIARDVIIKEEARCSSE